MAPLSVGERSRSEKAPWFSTCTGSRTKWVGTVEVVSPLEGAFSEEDRQLCYLFSKMAIFVDVLKHHVTLTAKAVKDQQAAQEAQEKSFKLLAHQVKTPLSTAFYAMERLQERVSWKSLVPDKIRETTSELRRALMRAWRVAQRMRVFSDLSTEGSITKIEFHSVAFAELVRRLEEMAEDHQRESAAKRGLSISVIQVKDKESLVYPLVMIDLDLVEQAVEILFGECAVKYGDQRSRIEIVIDMRNNTAVFRYCSVKNSGNKDSIPRSTK